MTDTDLVRKSRETLIAGAVLFLGQFIHAQSTLLPYSSDWYYSDLGHQPAPQGAYRWYEPEYDHSNWSHGEAQLGYGDGDEQTQIGDSVITAYFRHEFDVVDASVFGDLSLELLYDDGALIYINGQEVWRVNMPVGEIYYNTFSSSGSSDNAQANIDINIPLQDGSNVVAIEVHQRSSGSSDISFDFELEGNPPGQVRVVRGPYLQKLSDTAITVKWRTNIATESGVSFGLMLNQLDEHAFSSVLKIDHEIEIGGLTPDTRYFYFIQNATTTLVAPSSDFYFHTAPTAGTRKPIKAWVLGDCGTANNHARAVRDAYFSYIGNQHTDLILFLGDNAYSIGTDAEYQYALFENMYEDILKNTVSWSCLGNHDGASAYSATQTGPYYDIFTFPTMGESGGVPSLTEAYYSFDYGNIHFISLDSYDSDRSVGGPMYLWCQNDLQNTTADWVVAFWHHPAYSKGSHNSDTEGRLIDMRQNFLPLLEAHGVDLVLSGHSHSYERSFFLNGHYGDSDSFDPLVHTAGYSGDGDGRVDGDGSYQKNLGTLNGATYITGGSSGRVSNSDLDHEAMFYSVAELGSCIVEVNGGVMEVKFINDLGTIMDYFTIQKDLDCTVGALCDDNNICTIDDTITADCQCSGTPISNVPPHVILNNTNTPLSETIKATQSILASGDLGTKLHSSTILMAPEITLEPSFEVIVNSKFAIVQNGCD